MMNEDHSTSVKLSPISTPHRRPRERSISSLQGLSLSDSTDTAKAPRSISSSNSIDRPVSTQDPFTRDKIAALCTPPRRPRRKSTSSLEELLLTPTADTLTKSKAVSKQHDANPDLIIPDLQDSIAGSPTDVRGLISDPTKGTKSITMAGVGEESTQEGHGSFGSNSTTSHSFNMTPTDVTPDPKKTPPNSSSCQSTKEGDNIKNIKTMNTSKKRGMRGFRFRQRGAAGA